MTTGFRRLVWTLLLLLAPVPAWGQAQAPAREMSPQAREWLTEMRRIEGTLTSIRARALETPALKADMQALEADLRAAMLRADPGLAAEMEKLPALRSRAAAAQKSGDEAALRNAVRAGQALQQRVARAQQTALRTSGLMKRMEAFQVRLTRRMTEIDPRTRELTARFQELGARIQQSARPSR